MKSLFAWQALPPPAYGSEPAWIHRAARSGAVIALAGGLLQLGFGFQHGAVALLPLAVSALLFGLPHGAIDHLVALGLAGKGLNTRSLFCVAGLYLLLSILYGCLWLTAPGLAIVGFLMMTTYHWGQADTAFDALRFPDGPLSQCRLFRVTHSAIRGAIPIGLPLLVFPEQSTDFLLGCIGLFVEEPNPHINLYRPWVGSFIALLLGAELFMLWRHRSASGSRSFLLETGLLIAIFTLLPPLIAIGWYFCLWHGLRHVLRLTRYGPAQTGTRSGFRALGLFFYRALPFTLLSLLFLGLLGLSLPTESAPGRWIALYLVLISTLTFPHMLLVEWMDRTEFSTLGCADF